MAIPKLKAEFDELPPTEQIQLVQDLWDQIADRAPEIRVLDSHKVEVARRLADHQDSPDDVVPWETVKASLGRSSE